MTHSRFSKFRLVILVGIVVFVLAFSWNSIAQEGKSSLSGRVVDPDGKPVAGLTLAVKPVEIKGPRDMVPRTPFSSWPRMITDNAGRFFFPNIDPISSPKFTVWKPQALALGGKTALLERTKTENYICPWSEMRYTISPSLETSIMSVTAGLRAWLPLLSG